MYTVYSKDGCPYCARAKELLDILGEDYEVKDLTIEENRNEMLERVPGVKTIPQIFKDDQYIGGYAELVEFTK